MHYGRGEELREGEGRTKVRPAVLENTERGVSLISAQIDCRMVLHRICCFYPKKVETLGLGLQYGYRYD